MFDHRFVPLNALRHEHFQNLLHEPLKFILADAVGFRGGPIFRYQNFSLRFSVHIHSGTRYWGSPNYILLCTARAGHSTKVCVTPQTPRVRSAAGFHGESVPMGLTPAVQDGIPWKCRGVRWK